MKIDKWYADTCIKSQSAKEIDMKKKKKTRKNSQIFKKLKTKLWVAGEIVSDYTAQYRIYTQTQL